MTRGSGSFQRFLPALAWLAGALLLAGCDEAGEAPPAPPIPKVTTAEVAEREITDFDEYTGRTEASDSVDIHARVFGYLQSIDFHDGDFVEEGQTLFTIEPDEYEAIHNQSLSKIAVWESKLEVAKAQKARREQLLPRGAITKEEFEEYTAAEREAEASLVAAKADASRTAVDLNYTKVVAPISGRIDRAFVSKGTLLTGGVSSGTLLTKIVKDQPMYVYFDVDEQALLRYRRQRQGDSNAPAAQLKDLKIPCLLQLADEKDFPHQGVVDFAATEVNSTTGTARLRAVFANDDRELVSGLFVRVRIPVSDAHQALLIPERALATDQDIKFVYVVGDDGIANRRAIELGRQIGDERVVVSGLKAGERVIVKGLQRVRPGQKVEAEQASASETAAPATPAETEAHSPAESKPE